MRNGYESIHLQTVTAALPGSGQISSPCGTACPRSCACARDPTTVTEMPEPAQCKETGNRLRWYFGGYSTGFWTHVEQSSGQTPRKIVDPARFTNPCRARASLN